MFRKESGEVDMVSLILTVVIAAVTLLVGIVIVANSETSMQNIMLAQTINSPNSAIYISSYLNIMGNVGTSFNFLALGLFILAAIFIIGIISGVLGKGE